MDGESDQFYALNPNVVMIVGRKAEMDPNAQFEAKYMTPAA